MSGPGPRDLVREEVLAMRPYHVEPAAGMVKLDAMENPHALPEAIRRELGELLGRVDVNRYPDARHEGLKEALRDSMRLAPGQSLVLGNGSDEIIQVASLALARPGAVALSVEPSFVMYRMSAMQAGMRYVGVPLREDFSLDEAAVMAAMEEHRPALTWIAYPNNPTGNLFPREAVLRIVAAAPGLVAVDEAYFPFSNGASLLSEVGRHPNLLLVRTVSKLGMAGLRLGFAIGTREWCDELEKLRPPYNVNVLSAAAARFLLGHGEVFAGQAREIVAERARLERALDAMPAVRRFSSAANFVLVRLPGAGAAFEALKSRGILVRSFEGSHPLLANCLRLTVGTADENSRMLEALSSILAPKDAQG